MGIISIIVILLVAVGSFWLSTNISSTNTENTTDNTELADKILTPIEMAKEAKEAIEEGSVTSLNLSNQSLVKVPDTVFNQTELEHLNLSNNELEGSLPAEVRLLSNLKSLNLSHNNFTGVPAEIGQLANLEVLDLSFNKLTGLPYEFKNLANLQKLDLRGNSYSEADLAMIKEKLPKSTVVITDN